MEQPKVISTEEVYRGRIFNVSLATIKDGDLVYQREIISHPGSAVIVPYFDDETVALVRQYRHPTQKHLLELPAGSLSPNENPELGARRELEEEIGVTASEIRQLSEFYVSPGFLGEKMYVFLATGLQDTKQNLDEDEVLSIERISLKTAGDMILNGAIEDAKTIIGLTLTMNHLGIRFSG